MPKSSVDPFYTFFFVFALPLFSHPCCCFSAHLYHIIDQHTPHHRHPWLHTGHGPLPRAILSWPCCGYISHFVTGGRNIATITSRYDRSLQKPVPIVFLFFFLLVHIHFSQLTRS
ncbi:hypothetical protein BJ165DRAFT_368671 [Panaeolus papilionaceus]|nr:hypothetical protein BJ165DRAFT_368671 [Panaeolus papilionaceus]